MRATLINADAVPERAALTASTATDINGPVLSPMPIPARTSPIWARERPAGLRCSQDQEAACDQGGAAGGHDPHTNTLRHVT